MKQVERDFFKRGTFDILNEIIGMNLISEIGGVTTGGMIVEAEAYLGENDPGSFAYGGKRTKRSIPLYDEEGTIFVYLNYGIYFLLNIVTEPKENAGAILIRSILPEIGVDIMKKRRGRDTVKGLTDGPGKLSIALGITDKLNGYKIYSPTSPLKLFYGKRFPLSELKFTGRIGISRGQELPYRVLLKE